MAFSAPETTCFVGYDELNAAMRNYAAATGKKFGAVVKMQSRLIAWNFAHNSQPYGMDLATKKLGEAAVLRDIGLVFRSAQQMFKQLEDQGQPELAKAWYKLVKIGTNAKAEKLLRETKAADRNTPIFAPLDPQFHQKSRNRRGRVSRHRPAQIVPDAKEIREYTKKKKDLVGFGKAGWITAGSQLGSIRNVPAWITRHKGTAPGGCIDQSKSLEDPYVSMTNQVRYASALLSDSQAMQAMRLQEEKMLAHIEHVLVNTARESGFDSRPDRTSTALPAAA